MSAKPLEMVLLVAAAAAVAVLRDSLVATLVGVGVALLLVGFVWRRVLPTLLAGLLLYPAFALALADVVPLAWSCLGSGLLVIVLCERITFEYEMSGALEAPTGVDSEASALASGLSKAHARRLSAYAALAALVIVGAAVASAFTLYASELIAAAMLLMVLVLYYSTR
jgi:hypothetical protein